MSLEREKPYKMFACLPYLQMKTEKAIAMGPIRFYSSTQFDNYIGVKEQKEIKEYLKDAPNINKGTCICIHPEIEDEMVSELLIDALHLIYYSACYKELYFNNKTPNFDPLQQIVAASERVTKDPDYKQKIQKIQITSTQVTEIDTVDPDFCNALGALLFASYCPDIEGLDQVDAIEAKRIIRAIRYFVHCFYDRFKDLLGKGLSLKSMLFEPEDVLYVSTSFETLFDIDPSQPGPELKQKLRPILHLKFGKPLEVVWKWVDGFYAIHKQIIHEGKLPKQNFTYNQNFRISYLLFAIKLFIYSTYYKLVFMKVLTAPEKRKYMPMSFKDLDREEVIAFLWPEEDILKKISIIMLQIANGKIDDEYLFDLDMLAKIYLRMFSYYEGGSNQDENIKFIPSNKENLKRVVSAIKNLSGETIHLHRKEMKIYHLVPSEFISSLDKRVA